MSKVLIKDIIPYVENKYMVNTGKDNRALAGLSMNLKSQGYLEPLKCCETQKRFLIII